jgi:hypothetical protein
MDYLLVAGVPEPWEIKAGMIAGLICDACLNSDQYLMIMVLVAALAFVLFALLN